MPSYLAQCHHTWHSSYTGAPTLLVCCTVGVLELVFTRSSAFCGTLHGDEPEEGGSEVVVQKLLTDKFISVGVLIFPPSAEKPNCNNDIHDMVSVSLPTAEGL